MTRKTEEKFEYPYRWQNCPDKEKYHYNREGIRVPPDFNGNTGRSKTMVQTRCPTCHLFVCWEPKEKK